MFSSYVVSDCPYLQFTISLFMRAAVILLRTALQSCFAYMFAAFGGKHEARRLTRRYTSSDEAGYPWPKTV